MEMKKQWGCEWNGEVLYSHGTSRSKGVAILFNENPQICYKINSIFRDDQGRILIVDIDVNDHHFTLANIYGPNTDDPDFFSFVFDKIRSSSQTNLLLGGDFNITLDDELDKHGGPAHMNRKAREIILQ